MSFSIPNCRLIGIMLACGHITEKDTVLYLQREKFKKIIKPVLKFYQINYRKYPWDKANNLRIQWDTNGLFPVDARMIYVLEPGKIIPPLVTESPAKYVKGIPAEILKLSNEKLQHVLYGFMEIIVQQNEANNQTVRLQLHSTKVAKGLETILSQLNLPYELTHDEGIEIMYPLVDGTLHGDMGCFTFTLQPLPPQSYDCFLLTASGKTSDEKFDDAVKELQNLRIEVQKHHGLPEGTEEKEETENQIFTDENETEQNEFEAQQNNESEEINIFDNTEEDKKLQKLLDQVEVRYQKHAQKKENQQ